MTEQESTTTTLMPFTFDTHPVRVHVDDKGNPWWEAQDVCAILDIGDVSKAVARLKLGEKRTSPSRNVLIINESGLYRLIFRSNKKDAQRFQDWVFEEVLPQIRKTGRYEAEDPVERYPQLRAIRELVTATAEAQLAAERAQEQAEAAQRQATRAEAKAEAAEQIAREAVAATGRMRLEEFILGNKLLPQFPGKLDKDGRRSWPTEVARLKSYCQAYGWEIIPVPVQGKPWPTENEYPIQALAWLCRHPTGATQLGLVKGHTP